MPVASKPVPGRSPLHTLLLLRYLQLLRDRPILTKALTSGILSAIGNLVSQTIESQRKGQKSQKYLDLKGTFRFAVYGFFFTGPLSHYFYLFLEEAVPSTIPLAGLRRLLIERLIIAPAFLFLFFVLMNLLEGKNIATLNHKLKDSYWSALKMNWKVWTPFQFINVNYIPVQFRVLFANMVAFFWFVYLSSTRK
ncbi:hypothetical protein GDO86_001713 [Hymenochirus boettgeri]|uniref:Peroxisomal membrane protein 2 n=1 Tax=Hymenochirus boettgeri TaxID=247094 RepID=A0A8T2KI65_9PIPI|nr:hypothetical protein GDO86_001713 [Hymenochirus boettgeri]